MTTLAFFGRNKVARARRRTAAPALGALAALRAAAAAGGCAGDVASVDCTAWQGGFDAMGGAGWTHCSDKRDDPCSCSSAGNDGDVADVTCAGGRITRVSMHDNSATGTLPASWSAMNQLEFLRLGGMQISGELPAQWASMTKLKDLLLGGCQVSGELPAEWAAMARLKHLNLDNNQISGELPAQWANMTELEQLYL